MSPYKETEEHEPCFTKPPPDLIKGEKEYKVKQILDHCLYGRWKKHQYKIRWKGYSQAHDSWEPVENICAPELLESITGRNGPPPESEV